MSKVDIDHLEIDTPAEGGHEPEFFGSEAQRFPGFDQGPVELTADFSRRSSVHYTRRHSAH